MQAESTINPREIPFMRLLLPMLTGVLFSFWMPGCFLHAVWTMGGCFLLMLIFVFLNEKYQFRWLFGGLVLCSMLSFGYVLAVAHNDLNQSQHFSDFLDNKNTIIAKVNASPKLGKRLKTTLSVYAIRDSLGELQPANGNLLTYLEINNTSAQPVYGDVLVLRGWVQAVPPPMNPYQFDYQAYLHFQNVRYQAFVKKDDWVNTQINQGNTVLRLAQHIRFACIERLRKYLPTEREFSVGAALILGYKDEISEDVRNAYTQTGAMHVLAVSGLHVGLIYLFLNFFLGFVKSKSRTFKVVKPILLITGIWSFALLTGMSPSVMRAATMFSFIVIGISIKRYTNIYNTLACSAFFLLCFNPYLIANVGFQLSYLAVLGIVYFQPRIYRLITINHPLGDNLWALMAVSIAAQLATLPLSWYYFHQFPVFFWLASLIVVPAATFILALGVTSLILSVIPFVGFLFGKLLFGLIWVVNTLIFGIQQLPLGLVEGIWISVTVVLVLYLVLVMFAWFLKFRKPIAFLLTLILLLAVVAEYSYSFYEQTSQRKITVYHSYKNAIADFISGKNTTTIKGSRVGERQVGFAASNHQGALGIHANDKASFRGNYHNSSLFLQQHFIQFHDKKIVIIDNENLLKSSLSMDMDYVLVQDSPYLKILDIKDRFNPEMIIFDATNSRKSIEVWKKQCEEIGLVYHDVNTQGAWELNF